MSLSLSSALDGGWWLTPRSSRFIPGKDPGTHCIGALVGPRIILGGSGKSRPHQDSIPGPPNPQRVSILTALTRTTWMDTYVKKLGTSRRNSPKPAVFSDTSENKAALPTTKFLSSVTLYFRWDGMRKYEGGVTCNGSVLTTSTVKTRELDVPIP
jgi:hypothetical protein